MKKKMRIRFRADQELATLTFHSSSVWGWSWNGQVLHVRTPDGRKFAYPAWAVAGAEEVWG